MALFSKQNKNDADEIRAAALAELCDSDISDELVGDSKSQQYESLADQQSEYEQSKSSKASTSKNVKQSILKENQAIQCQNYLNSFFEDSQEDEALMDEQILREYQQSLLLTGDKSKSSRLPTLRDDEQSNPTENLVLQVKLIYISMLMLTLKYPFLSTKTM